MKKNTDKLKNYIKLAIQNAPDDVKQVASLTANYMTKNPNARWPEITAIPEMKKFPWVNNPSTPEGKMKNAKLLQIMNILKKLASNKVNRKVAPKTNSNKINTNKINTNNNINLQSVKPTINPQIPQKPVDSKYYLGYGYSLYKRTKDYNKSLSELKHKLQADNIPVTDQNSILTKFKEIF